MIVGVRSDLSNWRAAMSQSNWRQAAANEDASLFSEPLPVRVWARHHKYQLKHGLRKSIYVAR